MASADRNSQLISYQLLGSTHNTHYWLVDYGRRHSTKLAPPTHHTFFHFVKVEQLTVEGLTCTLHLSWFPTVTKSFWIPLSNEPVSPGHQSGDDLIQAVPEHTIGYSTVPLRAEEGVKL